MVGITLSPEQIRRAPAEVRRWLQGEIAASLGVDLEPTAGSELSNLATCSMEEAGAIYDRIRVAPRTANVFFELGRGGEFVTPEGLVAHRLVDMMRHAGLQTMEQLFAALQTINQAARELSGDPDVSLSVIDRRGYGYVPVDTQRSIAALWEQLVSRPDGSRAASASTDDERRAAAFPSLHGALPPEAAHMAGFGR
jgi:hypothetical protein